MIEFQTLEKGAVRSGGCKKGIQLPVQQQFPGVKGAVFLYTERDLRMQMLKSIQIGAVYAVSLVGVTPRRRGRARAPDGAGGSWRGWCYSKL